MRLSNFSERLVWWWATAVAVLLAFLFGWHTVALPLVYDAEGYRKIAQDILKDGVFSKFYLSELRTYGYPAFLSGVVRVAEAVGWSERWVGFGAQLGLHIGAAASFGVALRRAGVRSWAATAGYVGVVAHPFALLYPGYFLTESLSISMGTFLLAGGIAAWGRRLPGWFWVMGGVVCGAMAMVRPANLFMVPMWAVVVGLGLWRRQWVAGLGLVCILIPWWPQWENNRLYHGKSTPLVASELGPAMRMMGVMFLKYTTSIVPGADARVKYENPFLVDIEEGISDPLGWYAAHPAEGLKTWGSHVFNLLDQDLPWPYVEDLAPWYSPYVVGTNWAAVGLGLLTMAGVWRRSTGGERWAVVLVGVLILGHLAMHSLFSVEGRYGVAMLVPLYGLAAVGLVGLGRGGRRKEWMAAGAVVVLVSGGGVGLSTWMRRQAPAVQAATVERDPRLGEIVERLTGRRPMDTLCHSPWSTWGMTMAGVGSDEEGVLVSDGKQVSLIEHDVRIKPNREYTVEFEVRGEKGSTEELSVDLYGGAAYDHPEQNGVLRLHTGAYEPVRFTWNSGPDAPAGTRLRFATLARRPLRIRNVRFTGRDGTLEEWRKERVETGFDGEAVLCIGGVGVSLLSRGVALEKDTEYLVEFEVRGPAGRARPLRIDLFGGSDYDHKEQEAVVESFSGEFERKSFRWNSGADAPERADLRFETLSQKPIQVRDVRFRKVGER